MLGLYLQLRRPHWAIGGGSCGQHVFNDQGYQGRGQLRGGVVPEGKACMSTQAPVMEVWSSKMCSVGQERLSSNVIIISSEGGR